MQSYKEIKGETITGVLGGEGEAEERRREDGEGWVAPKAF